MKAKRFFVFITTFMLLNFALFYGNVFSATEPIPPSGGFTLTNPIGSNDFAQIMKKIAELVVKIALPILVVMVIWAGAQFVFAQGNEKKLEDAKKTLWYSLIGALLVVGAFAIATAIENFAKKL